MPSDLVEVVFKGNRTGIYSNPVGITLKTGDYVIVEAERGEDIGIVVALGRVVSLKEMDTEPKKLMRLATDDDLNKLKTNRIEEESAFEVCKEKINKHNLNMKLVDVEYQFDKNKLTFYFTSDQRVDFRQLVRDLASKYKTRIELRQIGVRDEAKRLGGYGTCGYKLCETITTQHAKEQLLPMNPSKLSGVCGRLKCCLSFEKIFYLKELEKYPEVDKQIITPNGRGIVDKVDIFHGWVYVRLANDDLEKFTLDQLQDSTASPATEEA
ncbi:MAG: regulatory iron-sulfur-containing complex subunit RicT [Calditrichia bacterium]